MKIWIASDNTNGRMLEVEDSDKLPTEIAYEYGRAESGEIIDIWYDGNDNKEPDAVVYWDWQRRRYMRHGY